MVLENASRAIPLPATRRPPPHRARRARPASRPRRARGRRRARCSDAASWPPITPSSSASDTCASPRATRVCREALASRNARSRARAVPQDLHATISAAFPTMRANRGTVCSRSTCAQYSTSASRPGGPYVRAFSPSSGDGHARGDHARRDRGVEPFAAERVDDPAGAVRIVERECALEAGADDRDVAAGRARASPATAERLSSDPIRTTSQRAAAREDRRASRSSSSGSASSPSAARRTRAARRRRRSPRSRPRCARRRRPPRRRARSRSARASSISAQQSTRS